MDTPTYAQFTNQGLGEGLFDQLMTAVKKHLQDEFDEQRIVGSQYSTAYVGSMESVLSNTTQYLLGLLLIDEKAAKLESDNKLVEAQIRKLDFETDYLLPKELEKIDAEIAKINAEIALLGAQKLLTDAQELLTDAQTSKTAKEEAFLDAKILTELANTDETVADAGSLVGRQQSLLHAQKYGFAGDLEAKSAKLHADYDAVFQSVQENPGDATLGLNATDTITTALTTATTIKSL